MSGWVTFRLGSRDLAARLDEVREVVRAVGLDRLDGTPPPVDGVLVLRGVPLPVVDLRSSAVATYGGGDVLVLAASGPAESLGVAVDRVLAVQPAEALAADAAPLPAGLPPYVHGVLRAPGSDVPVLLVTLRALAGLVPA